MIKTLHCLLLILAIVLNLSYAEKVKTVTYVNSGFRIGYTFGEGYTLSTEIAVGISVWFVDLPIHSSIAVGYQFNPYAPEKLYYIAGQGGILSFGASVGRTFYRFKDKLNTGSRIAGYVGLPVGAWDQKNGCLERQNGECLEWGPVSSYRNWALAFVSYEYEKFPLLNKSYHNLGIWGKASYTSAYFSVP